ncbi:hypothetical protein GWJ07_20655 [Proteus sp. G2639]|uniref:hypothetical protein n=2 Tax=Proteus TaxID=583 RepID=UPI0003C5EC68|nr:hypothetical protein K151_1959 [Proteus hauseri ZMd44]NBN62000.1 hypothetical protein [Proteus sp. G2639]
MEQQLIEALKNSMNFLTLAIFSFIACFAMFRAMNDRKKKKIKTSWLTHKIFWFYIILFLILGLISIGLILLEFMYKPGGGWIVAAVGIITVFVIINAGTVVFGKLEHFSKEEKSIDDTIYRLLGTDKYLVTWIIQIDNKDDVVFSRITDRKVDESYTPVSRDKANVYAVSILNGFEPPEHL